ncbi:hypothetical protein NDU88_007612 [Pleurodeles waltl]|uniref:Uncharacterized protein n=1 Tax=Pleurodeles waltl TaxID=8319 RepID=A0AAV7U0B9_PLEWA|nr:hypothetical protein NDU88_007612 [Pleurodeles waltl]
MDRPSKQAPPSPEPTPSVTLVSRWRSFASEALGPESHHLRVRAARSRARVKAGRAAQPSCRPPAPAPDAPHLARGNLATGTLGSVGRPGVPPRREPRPDPAAPQAGRSTAIKRPRRRRSDPCVRSSRHLGHAP